MSKKKRLGRTLDSLLSKPLTETSAVTGVKSGAAVSADDVLKAIPVELLQRGQYQPREDMRQDCRNNPQ